MRQVSRSICQKFLIHHDRKQYIDARIVIGVLIIKYLEKKDDRGTIEAIQEYSYMQDFLKFDYFTHNLVFDPSLFVHIRKRLGNEVFDAMNQVIISGILVIDPQKPDNKDIDGSISMILIRTTLIKQTNSWFPIIGSCSWMQPFVMLTSSI
mgnify:CR=1 FL=1